MQLRALVHERQERLVNGLALEEAANKEGIFIDIQHVPHAESDTDFSDDLISDRSSWYQSIQNSQSEEEMLRSPKSQYEPDHVDYTFAWSVATQKGYKYADPHLRGHKIDIHAKMEDMHYPSFKDSPNHIHALSGRPFQLFLLADGHGGHNCAQYAIETLPTQILTLINSKIWNFNHHEDQVTFRKELQGVFLNYDDEYCSQKLEQFRNFVSNFNGISRPADDGCTLVMNVFYEGFLINANVGDSRSLLLARNEPSFSTSSESIVWNPDFASIDHTPGHPDKAHQIQMNGGRFIINGSTANVKHFFEKENQSEDSFEFLSRCRIGRAPGWIIDELNYPACTTLNLAGTMGDLFFKYNPPLISAKPDVSFVRINPLEKKYILVMASDGLWDHMAHQVPEVQHNMVASYVNATMEHADVSSYSFFVHDQKSDDEVDENAERDPLHEKLQKLGILAHGMADREMVTCKSNLYLPNFMRYDDVTVFVVLIEGINDTQSENDTSTL